MLLTFFSLQTIAHSNMNGDVYGISNPDTYSKIKFPTNFNEINSSYEYFEVYSPPITSKYGDVYWTMMPKVKLPSEIIKRFFFTFEVSFFSRSLVTLLKK